MTTYRVCATLLATLLSTVVMSSPALAQADPTVREAMTLANTGQGKQAFDMLDPLELARAGDPEFDTVFGIAANEAGQYTRAIMALERVLAVQPENARARAEMGRSLFAVGDRAGARAFLLETKAQGIPIAVSSTIDEFLQAIDRVDAAGKSSYRGYVEFGLGHDTNANSGPSNSNVAVPAFGNLIFTLNPSGLNTRTDFATLGAGLSGRYVIDPRLSLIGTAAANGRFNSGSADQFDSGQIDASGGVAYRVEKEEYSLVGQVGTFTVDGSRARDQFGLVGEWTHKFDSFRQIGTYVQLSRLEYPTQGIRDADRTVFGTSYSHLFRDGRLAYGGLYFGEEDTRASNVDHLGHKVWGLRIGGQQPIRDNLAAFATLGYEHRKYNGDDPLFLRTRVDKQTNFNIGLNWIPMPTWRVTPQLAFTRVSSNIAISDYDRNILSVVVRKDF